MAHTEYTSVVAKAIFDKLLLNIDTLKLQDVLYGNQLMIPRSPAVVVTPGPKRRDLVGVQGPGGRTHNTLVVYVDVLDSKVDDETTQRLILDQTAETIERKIHEDVTLGGIIIHGFFKVWNPGETFIQGGMFRTVRMTFEGQSRTLLGV